MESQDSAAFAATVALSRAEYVRQIQATARETLARSRGNEFRDADEPLGVSEQRSRGRRAPLAPRDRTPPAPVSTAPFGAVDPAPQPNTQVPTWADERAAVFEAIYALRVLGETLTERLAELRQAQTRELGMLGAWRSLNRWEHEERAQIEEAAGGSRDDDEQEPFELPPLRSLRQT